MTQLIYFILTGQDNNMLTNMILVNLKNAFDTLD